MEGYGLQQDNIEEMKKDIILLLNEQLHEIFEPLVQTPDFFKKQDQQRNLSGDLINQWTGNIRDELYKAERLEVTFVVVGTMKAGKSTTINAVVGMELLPNRNQPMTIVPTIIRHCPGKKEPELNFPNPKPFNQLIERLLEKLQEMQSRGELADFAFCTTSDGKALIEAILSGSLREIASHYQGNDGIFRFLTCVNDIWRLCGTDEIAIDIDDYLHQYQHIQDLPAIEVEFFHLRDQDYEGKFALIDTPGHNEAGQTVLKNIVEEQLEKASAVIVILDYTQMNAEAEAELRKSLGGIEHINGNQSFILVNKYDQKDRNGMDMETLRSYVATQLFAGRVNTERVFPVSGKYAYLANRALNELSVNGALPVAADNLWIDDFGQLAFGTGWESDIDDGEEVKSRAARLWKNSRFEQPLREVIQNGLENAAIVSLKSAIGKMAAYDKQIIESVQFRSNALNTDIKIIESQIKSLEEDIEKIKNARADLTVSTNRSIKVLQEKIFNMVYASDNLLKKEIQTSFSNKKEGNWLEQRLKVCSKEKQQEVMFNPADNVSFTAEGEARDFLRQLSEVLMNAFQYIQQNIRAHIDEVVDKISLETASRLEPLLWTAEQRLNESFAVSIEFPKPELKAMIDVEKILASSIEEGSITRTSTKLERKWYTLWIHKHELIYNYEEKVFNITTGDVLKQFQNLLNEDSHGIWASLDEYVRSELTEAINTYFAEVFGYLERLKGDLADSKNDQELATAHIEKLQAAMNRVMKTATFHREDVLAFRQAIEERERAGQK
mgnify:CR=1 FL=1